MNKSKILLVIFCCYCLFTRLYLTFFVTPWTLSLEPSRLLCPWDFPGKNAGVDCHFLLKRIFWTQRSQPCSPAPPVLAGRFFTRSAAGVWRVWPPGQLGSSIPPRPCPSVERQQASNLDSAIRFRKFSEKWSYSMKIRLGSPQVPSSVPLLGLSTCICVPTTLSPELFRGGPKRHPGAGLAHNRSREHHRYLIIGSN